MGVVTWRPEDQSGRILAFWRFGVPVDAIRPPPSQSSQACTFITHDNVFEVRQIEVDISIQPIPMLKDSR